MDQTKLVFRVHAVRRMFERGITVQEVRRVLDEGKVIASYPDDTPYPSRLVLGWSDDRPIHVVAAENAQSEETVIVTVYEPDPMIWAPTFEWRRMQ